MRKCNKKAEKYCILCTRDLVKLTWPSWCATVCEGAIASEVAVLLSVLVQGVQGWLQRPGGNKQCWQDVDLSLAAGFKVSGVIHILKMHEYRKQPILQNGYISYVKLQLTTSEKSIK